MSYKLVKSQSLVTSGGATIGHPLVMTGSFFFPTILQGDHQLSEFIISEHFLVSSIGFEILTNSVQVPLLMLMKMCLLC